MPILRMQNIHKAFAGNPVLRGVNFEVKAGEVHALLGENGAGKSTLIKILTGVYQKDAGEIWWEGRVVEINTPVDAMRLGIATIYQELNLVPHLTVYENLFLGQEVRRTKHLPFLNKTYMRRRAIECLRLLGQPLDPDAPVSTLGIGQQQLVEIAKALVRDAKLIIMDEPTASLSEAEVEQLFTTIDALRAKGVAFVYISHRLEEIRRIGDRVTILRDGQTLATHDAKRVPTDTIIEQMVGRKLEEKFPKKRFIRGAEGLRVENLKRKGAQHAVSFVAYQGEILGIAGLVGAGRTELARAIFGVDPVESGKVFVFGQEVHIRSPADAIRAGIAFITEDRKREGLFLDQPLPFNVTIASLPSFKNRVLLSRSKIKETTERYMRELRVRPFKSELSARKLSGGNQQKIVIAKWLCTKAKVFLFDEPTRGIDVGAKVEVYHLINALVDNGAVVILISSELPELLGMCDRILVMHEGRIVADLPREEATQEKIMKAATGGMTR
ncbi:sugar ABC transporter ATP-binding protein [Calditerricola satsumensis]|uniref:Monosaccharide-transporting ATPase n=2 Tax=Calditerricola satsumensis TaxID=373054 RepID=A0A8J3B9F1_9BACI|nr:sugar ABC transporter ATP-binding protein [Calditerricola satsumensis]GGJ98736.1 monosaccharide-transporting ATPase [Calditerricola satsumensis]